MDKSHGAAWDRGATDSYYSRRPRPHHRLGDAEVTEPNMSQSEIEEYRAGYAWNERYGDKKQYV